MTSDHLQQVFAVLDDLETGGYEHLLNYPVWRQSFAAPSSVLRGLYSDIRQLRPHMDTVNLLCTLNGALCYLASAQMTTDMARLVFDDEGRFAGFIAEHRHGLLEIILTHNNNPTIPQRAMPIACHLPMAGIGLLELGCSRGDIGLTLMNLAQITAHPERYLFSEFIKAVPSEILQTARPIGRYFGVDLDISLNDAWLLALWGIRDERRIQLANFYADFVPIDTNHFWRIQADACDLSAYANEALEFFDAETTLVVLTSFMIYQLAHHQRVALIEAIHEVQDNFLRGRHGRTVLWLDQGMELEAMMRGTFNFARCYLNKLWFEDDALWGLPLARLANDACEGWDALDSGPVMVKHEF